MNKKIKFLLFSIILLSIFHKNTFSMDGFILPNGIIKPLYFTYNEIPKEDLDIRPYQYCKTPETQKQFFGSRYERMQLDPNMSHYGIGDPKSHLFIFDTQKSTKSDKEKVASLVIDWNNISSKKLVTNMPLGNFFFISRKFMIESCEKQIKLIGKIDENCKFIEISNNYENTVCKDIQQMIKGTYTGKLSIPYKNGYIGLRYNGNENEELTWSLFYFSLDANNYYHLMLPRVFRTCITKDCGSIEYKGRIIGTNKQSNGKYPRFKKFATNLSQIELNKATSDYLQNLLKGKEKNKYFAEILKKAKIEIDKLYTTKK